VVYVVGEQGKRKLALTTPEVVLASIKEDKQKKNRTKGR
jgi:hypothetical protein